MQLHEVFGFAAGAIGVYMAVPQARHIRKLGHGEGVSLTYWIVLLVVDASWLSYGIIIDSPSLIVTDILGFITSAMVVTALLDKGWVTWPVLFVAGAVWVLLIKLLPLAVITLFLVALTFNRLPQIWRSIQNLRRGAASAVSLKSQYYLLAAVVLWEVYSVLSNRLSLVLITTTGLTLTATVIALELLSRRKASNRATTAAAS